MRMELAIRFDYGMTVPWVKKRHFGLTALSGAHALQLQTPIQMEGRDFRHYAEFDVGPGDVVPFVLAYHSSIEQEHTLEDAEEWTEDTTKWWQEWASKCNCEGPYSEAVTRSLITLKALTNQSSGGIVAAPTTSLPETIGGQRNWDYRYCWLRDATFTLYALVISGLTPRPRRGATGCCAWRQASHRSCRQSTARRASACCRSPCSTGSTATKAANPCEWATRRTGNYSSTSTAKSWTCFTSRRRPASRTHRTHGSYNER